MKIDKPNYVELFVEYRDEAPPMSDKMCATAASLILDCMKYMSENDNTLHVLPFGMIVSIRASEGQVQINTETSNEVFITALRAEWQSKALGDHFRLTVFQQVIEEGNEGMYHSTIDKNGRFDSVEIPRDGLFMRSLNRLLYGEWHDTRTTRVSTEVARSV